MTQDGEPLPASPPAAWERRCSACGRIYPAVGSEWRCACGGLLQMRGPVAADPVDPAGPWSLWRYSPALPPLPAWPRITLGEGMTPLVEAGADCWWKLDFLTPTLSFKDRGAAVLMAAAAGAGIGRVVADSSGNAGTAVAAYAARAGIAADIWVPSGTSAHKVAAMEAHGATVHRAVGGGARGGGPVDGRAAAAAAARRQVEESGAFYASHVYQPLFTQGVKTVAFEIWEQLGRRPPATVIVPAGNGTLVIGVSAGFSDLAAAGLVTRAPRIVAVQAERCAPLAGLAFGGPTVAEGIAVADPPRRGEILDAVAASGGEVVVVDDDAILAARDDLARSGVWVEPTAAAAWAAWKTGPAVTSEGGTVVVLGGAGLKAD